MTAFYGTLLHYIEISSTIVIIFLGTRKLKYNYVFENEIKNRYGDVWTSTDNDRNVSVASSNSLI